MLQKQNQSHLSRIKSHPENELSAYSSTDDLEYDTFDLIKHDPLYIAVPLTILYSFILITGITGNVVTCVVILKNKYLHTTTNYYLFSLAISDLLLLTFGLPQEIYYIWSRYPYIFGETFCILRGLMAETSTNATVLTITAFSFERYLAICHPFLAHTMSDSYRVIKYIVIIWVAALLCAIPQALQFGVISHGGPELIVCTLKHELFPNSFEMSTLFFFILPMVVITILYIRIGIKLKRSPGLKQRRMSRTMLGATNQKNSSRSLIGYGTSRNVLKMLVAVVITFFVCWAPFHIQRLVAMHIRTPAANKIYDVVTYISAILYYTSSTVNPILYHTMSNRFRDAFKDTAMSLCRARHESNNTSYKRDKAERSRIIYKDGRNFTIIITTKDKNSSFLSDRSGKLLRQAVNEITNKDYDGGENSKKSSINHV